MGRALPPLSFAATTGAPVDLADPMLGDAVLFVYPRISRPGEPDAEQWAALPGAQGCTAESCEFRDLNAEFGEIGYRLLGLSAQRHEEQREAAERLHLPYPLLADPELRLVNALGLETFEFGGATLYRRITFVIGAGLIRRVETRIDAPAEHPRVLLEDLRDAQPQPQARMTWSELPDDLRAEIEAVLGSPVVEAVSQSHGFSSGTADRVVTASGRRAFVKTAFDGHNAGTTALHRRELAVMRAMPDGVAAPSLLGGVDRGGWVALVLDDIAGVHPGAGLDGSDLARVLDALGSLPRVRGTLAIELPDASDEIAEDARGWDDLAHDAALDTLPEWARSNLGRLAEASRRAPSAVAGDHLVHLDSRADNLLVDADGRIWIVDWPWAAIGAPWFDALMYVFDARHRREAFDAEATLAAHPVFAGVSADEIDAVLAAVTGMFFDKARRPAPPGMPTLRAFQRSEGEAGLAWLRERWREPAS